MSDKNDTQTATDAMTRNGLDSKNHGGIDTAWEFLNRHRDTKTAEDADSVGTNALRRKIDWHIVPLMFACYLMQFLDKVILNVRIIPFQPKRYTLVQTDRRTVCRCDGTQAGS
jgi:hypothetical protein